MINIELNDMLVFEDEVGNIYQDCICDIGSKTFGNHICNDFVLSKIKNMKGFDLETNCKIESKKFPNKNLKLKEIWHRTDEDTYKKVAELVDGKLTTISYINGMKVYHKRQEITYEQIKDFIVKE